jgi:predicted PurR-regulated permease PerM
MNKKTDRQLAEFLQIASLLIVALVMYVARDVLITVALGTLVAFVLSPLVNRLQSWGMSNTLAVLTSAFCVFALLSILLLGLLSSLDQIAEEVPKYRQEIARKLNSIEPTIEEYKNRLSLTDRHSADQAPKKNPAIKKGTPGEDDESTKADPTIFDRILGINKFDANDGSSPEKPLYVTDSSSTVLSLKDWAGGLILIFGPLGTLGLVFIIALFGLLYREDLRDRLVSVISRGNYVVTAEAIEESSARIGRYLFAQLALNVSYGFVFTCGLIGIGYGLTPEGVFPHVFLLGTFAGVVRFIPYLGPLIGAAFPLLISILLFPGFQVFIAVAVLIIVLELISNNLVEPWLYGSSTGVSPVAIILSAIFWGWLWGPIGVLLATPMTVCLVVLGRYVPRFRFFATLLSDEEQVSSHVRGYQRLLSGEQRRFDQFVSDELKEREALEFLDQTFAPLVKLIQSDEKRLQRGTGELFGKLQTGLRSVDLIVPSNEETTEDQQDTQESVDAGSKEESTVHRLDLRPTLTFLPLNDAGDLLLAQVIGKQLETDFQINLANYLEVSESTFMMTMESQPDVIVITMIPPGRGSQAKYWCAELRRQGFQGTILVACIGRFRAHGELLRSFRRKGANFITTTIGQSTRKLKLFASRHRPTAKPLERQVGSA